MTGIAVPGMDSYEDMFKEITRKLYGEEDMENTDTMRVMQEYDGETFKVDEAHNSLTAFGLAALMQNGFTTPTLLSTHVQMDTSSDKLKQDEDQWISSEEVIPWTPSKIASYNAAQKLFRCNECECVGFLSRVAEHWLGTHANLRVFQCPQCPYASAWARCVRMHLARQHNVCPDQNPDSLSTLWKENPVLEEVTKYLQRLKTKVESEATTTVNIKIEPQEFTNTTTQTTQTPVTTVPTLVPTPPQQPVQQQPQSQATTPQQQSRSTNNDQTTSTSPKRYNCSYCHYKTDRRDLYTRHENIHRDEKPFHCYVCQKQFNRADHVKKHFLRMHRDQPYDINRIRRTITKESNPLPPPPTATTFYPTKSVEQVQQQPQSLPPNIQHQQQQTEPVHINITIPGYTQRSSGDDKKSRQKKPGEKRYSCCYCSWSGVDNWCLKRHLNTHLKPFVCSLCEYKAARSERLATHVFKVHNKRACSRCSFLADDQAQLSLHQQQHHQEENALRRKRPGQERYSCRYCSWAGIDNWGLKRHLNTHLKPFVCRFCDYKAARSERLATHVLTVHNRSMCSHCNFSTDNQTELRIHQQRQHHHINNNSSITNNCNISSLQNTGYPPPPPLTVIANIENSSTNNPSSNHEDATGQMTPSRPPPPLTPINGLASTSLVNGEQLKAMPVGLIKNSLHQDNTSLKRSPSLEIIQYAEEDDESEQNPDDHNHESGIMEETKQRTYRCAICSLQTDTHEAMLLHLNFHSPNNFNLNTTTEDDDQLEIIPIQTIITEETNDDDGDNDYTKRELMENNNVDMENEYIIYNGVGRKVLKNFQYKRKCHICSKKSISKFNGLVNYAVHLLNCHVKTKIICKQCKTKFRHKYQLALHKKLLQCKTVIPNTTSNNKHSKKRRIMSTAAINLFTKTGQGFKLNNNYTNNNNNNNISNNNKCKRLNGLITKCNRRLQEI